MTGLDTHHNSQAAGDTPRRGSHAISGGYHPASSPGGQRNPLAMYIWLRRNPVRAVGVLALTLLMAIGCGESGPGQYETTASNDTKPLSVIRPTLSESARAGETLFNANCTLCHGANAAGTHQGPPLIHKIYEPGHHSDFSFRNAVRRGVRQHHWQFGDMPPVTTVSTAEVAQITCYIREMQRANGIFEGDALGTQC